MATILQTTPIPILSSRLSFPIAKIDLSQKRFGVCGSVYLQKKKCSRGMKSVPASVAAPPRKAEISEAESPTSELEPVDPGFYGIGYPRHTNFFGVEFKEGPDGIGLYAARDVPHLRRPRVILEIPLEIMLTVSKDLPWMFFPDIVPIGHPIFDIINSTDPKTDWDLRLACLLLLAFEIDDNFWQLYGDFLPSADQSTSLLLAKEEELMELQDQSLATTIKAQQQRVTNFWKKHWHVGIPFKLKRLARDPERFLWATSIAQSRCITTTISDGLGSLVQVANMLIPYADMINHSFQPNCSYRWRKKDRMLEVIINAGQSIKAGDEMSFSYMDRGTNDMFMAQYGFSSPVNPWHKLEFSGKAKIHLDSFISVFNVTGSEDEFYHNESLSDEEDKFVDGAILAAARTLPTWSEGNFPFLPSMEKKAVEELQEECRKMLAMFPTTIDEDLRILEVDTSGRSKIFENAIKYRIHHKQLINKIIKALSLYMERILF